MEPLIHSAVEALCSVLPATTPTIDELDEKIRTAEAENQGLGARLIEARQKASEAAHQLDREIEAHSNLPLHSPDGSSMIDSSPS